MSFQTDYQALTSACGVAILPERTQIELSGSDRTSFLHGLCTNDIRGLPPGKSCEAFLTNVQGKTIGHLYVHQLPDAIVVETTAGQGSTIIAALDRYLIREEVQLHDRSGDWSELLVCGPQSEEVLRSCDLDAVGQMWEHQTVMRGSDRLSIRAVPYCGRTTRLISGERAVIAELLRALSDQGAIECAKEAIETLRIETGTPLFGIDVTADNLPQEVNRNALAISFTKGCYLGQETVARIDARGHVNRLLVGLRFDGRQVPVGGTVLHVDGKPAARITSSCFSPKLSAPFALAYVRRGLESLGQQIVDESWQATVVQPPLDPATA